MQLRDYQSAAVDAVWNHIRDRDDNPCVVIPTGGGKTPVLATLATQAATLWRGRVCILAHVKELLEQSVDKLRQIAPDLDVGVYSAGLGKRDTRHAVIVAGIQSVYNKADEVGPFDVVIVDEAHMVPVDGDGMYRRFLADLQEMTPHTRIIGLTATPYRMADGYICGPENILNAICYEVGVKELINRGFLSRLVSKEAIACDTSGLHKRGGEFVPEEAERLMLDIVGPACEDIARRTAQRNSVLVFCQSVDHAYQVFERLKAVAESAIITGDTDADSRSDAVARFRRGEIKYLVNVQVLCVGFDAPNVDCVCLLRPTLSPGLYYQQVGRGFRIAEGKVDCLVLDYAGNVKRHGPIDQIVPKPRTVGGKDSEAPTKVCPECDSVMHAAVTVCLDCGWVFPEKPVKHDARPDSTGVMSGDFEDVEYPVKDIRYMRHVSKQSGFATLRVDYKIAPVRWISEWVCIEHDGYARRKAHLWWRARTNDEMPDFVDRAIDIAEGGGLAIAETITVREVVGEKWPKIVAVKLGPKPEPVDAAESDFEFPTGFEQTETTADTEGLPSWAKLDW